ncbi:MULTISPECIES: WYL domain-containing protein [Aliarcobacter]|uniref:WYL domain-containing protein n=1 Tax=Aliarcobacter TaxID=2321111 RepID=UPI0010FF401B|nr:MULTISPECIES: WYL domain-containing protein [Aliarcobacter]MCT7606881.1 WYL domain-containing protein [Aliarcobacter butzleri]MCT7646397.1 WYL domain-containing protein [Aliarcobacter butzleri]TLT02791.1 WYL domain-containing protein [Aliarcobacter cibarius]
MSLKKSTLLLSLLKELLEGKKISLKNFALENDVNIRTSQRYIEDIQEVFSDNLVKEDELYSFISNLTLEKNILNFDKKELEIFVDLYSLLEFDFSSKLDENTKKFVKKLEKTYSQIYMIKQNPFEKFSLKKELLIDVKTAIKHNRYSKIEYESDKKYTFDEVKILKIIFAEGNFYIAVLTKDETNNGFKFLRLNFISSITLYTNSFKKDIESEYFLKNFQTLFSSYKEKPYEVVLKINSSVKRFFLQKKFLPSQKIVENKKDLILSFEITNDMEILPLVKKWLPNIEIISPVSIKGKFNKELLDYLKIIK